LARLYQAGSKATAHLTFDAPHGLVTELEFRPAILLVERLLKSHLYDKTGIKMERFRG